FVPLAELAGHGPAILAGLETLDLLCLDGMEQVAGMPEWERALFNLYNEMSAIGGNLVISAPATPASLALELADLASRFASGLILRLADVDDDGRAMLLRKLAARRGMELPASVAEFMLRRLPRTAPDLSRAVARLDAASLSAQRKLTVPFVRTVLNLDGVDDAGERL
ncbi:MAG: DnaA regulatory inactivator Hda, partial [Gammaproteobacteria bacterium]|nr:DnaA regulatory inactivator Hda [Gammaproteobacteria bacterium]